ncbi:hypothetical protein [Hymenobacter actinosclerus]|uniref:PH domain-containing protein n=1 Tax=Hymenobacter actinosclerus TaxID=82805 RepID=A0A1I0I7F3_9BACT|nr:hypothetical protein [Hymenobacter actinosclerus]SET91857.1 hypothetical protein SAMN04487998_3155 [Hymenobacter actinosclerus]
MPVDTATLLGVFVLVLLVVVLPVMMSVNQHWHDKKLVQPVVQFTYIWWRNLSLWWTLLQTSFGLALLVAAGLLAVRWGPGPLTFIAAAVLLLVAWRQFPAIRLYWTYWQWDGQARLRFDRVQKVVTYTNREINLTFAVSAVSALSFYQEAWSRPPSADYSYTMLHLADGRQLVITSLLCDSLDWISLVPAVKTEVITPSFAWLPADTTSGRFFTPFN